MKERIKNEKLDVLTGNLLRSTRLSGDEIEKIIAAPGLFEAVRESIKKEETRRAPKRTVFPVWNWQTATGAFAFLFVAAFGAIAILLAPNLPQDLSVASASADAPDPVAKQENTDLSVASASADAPDVELVQRADFKTSAEKRAKSVARKPKKSEQPQPDEHDGAFYMLALAGNWEADAQDLRIVRAELSPSELFALGVNLPVENDTQKIKTDLLVGANGVPKAIRFVE